MRSDLEIAQAANKRPILELATDRLGIPTEQLEPYGRFKAKLSLEYIDTLASRPNGKLVLVTAISPTPAGEGKTTTTVGLGDALNHIGKRAIMCLREPSLGPVFGMKGGAAGGGMAQIVPMEDINLHFTGDFNAIALANNLLALSLPYAALCLPLAVLLLRAAFAELPPDLEDAARLEGLNLPQRLRHVLLPLLAPSLASTAILVFLFSWNEYPIALTWISRPELLTLPPAIARLAGSSLFTVPYGAFAAATVLGSLPLLLLVLIFQRSIVSGLTQGAIKG